MNSKLQSAKLEGLLGQIVATAFVSGDGASFSGTIDLRTTPPTVRALFEEFEQAVNDQVFTLADGIQKKFAAMWIKAMFDDGSADLCDLQVFPSAGDVSFRLASAPALAIKSA